MNSPFSGKDSILPLFVGFRFGRFLCFCKREDAFAELMEQNGAYSHHRQMQGAQSR